MDAFLNKTIKGYELRQRVGAGSSGIVYRAYQSSVGREVAIKIIQPQLANQSEFVRRFEVEAQLVARLEHPHIVPLFDYWRDPEGAYLVMRWLPGNLRAAATRGVWSPNAAARLLDQITAALTIAHRDNVIHRDIKPDNILLDEDENAYLADFSIAKDLSLRDVPYKLSASPAYISPEQIRNEPLTLRTDIYSLGYVIYEILTGEPAFPDANTPDEYIDHHLHTPLPLVSQRSPQIPGTLDEVLQTATAKDPTHRYISTARFAAAFRAALPVATSRTQAQPLVDPLTERELDVLRLMVDGEDNHEISRKLYLSPSTVKWYVKQIYSKLDAHSRYQAIERARLMGLVEPTVVSLSSANLIQEAKPSTHFNAESSDLEPVNPYKGLRAFQEADAVDFFGRAAFIEQLLNHLLDSEAGGRFLVLVGPSGSGKSSVVKAGLIPALRRGALPEIPRPFIAEMNPGTQPLEELESALLRVSVNPIPALLDQLREDRRGLVRAAKRILPADPGAEIILVIDQFEELFTLVTGEDTRQQFLDQLLSAASDPRGRVRIILSLRADFYDRPLLYPRFAELVRSHTEVILPLSDREMEQAIVAPADRVGLRLEAGLPATIIRDVGEQPGTLPLLQYALTELFEQREGVVLTLEAYRSLGGVLKALTQRADDIYDQFDPASQQMAKQLFLRMVTLGEGTEDTRRRVPLSELNGLGEEGVVEDVVNSFIKYRLLTLDRDPLTHTPTVEIAHEALIREWGKLREWLAESREDIRVQRRLSYMADEWGRSDNDASFLARGSQLAQFEGWAVETEIALSSLEREFLEASLTQRQYEAEAEAKRQAREKQLEQRSRTFLRGLVAVFALAALLAVGLSLIAFSERNRAQAALASSEQNLSVSRELALVNGAQAAFANNDIDTARALSLEAVEFPNPSNATYQMLADAAYAPGTIRVLHDDQYNHAWLGATLSPDERYLITVGDPIWQPVIWDLISGEFVGVFPESQIGDVVFRPTADSNDWQVLTLSGANMTLWDFEQRQPLHTFTGHTDEIWDAKFSPDGERIISGSVGGQIYLWDTDSGEILHTLEGHTDAINAVRFSPDGTTALSSSMDGTVALWDVAAGMLNDQIDMGFVPVHLAFSPTGDQFLVTGAGTRTMLLWDIADRREIRRFSHIGPVYSPHFSRDGQTVMAATGNHIVFWDIERTAVLRTLVGHSYATPFFPLADQTGLVSYSPDGTIRLWDLRDGTDIINVQIPRLGTDADISPDEQTFVVASGGADEDSRQPGLVILLDAATGAEIRRFGENGVAHTGSPNSVRFSPNGEMILSSDRSGEIKLWNVEDGTLLHSYPGLSSSVNSVEFTPDGSAFIAATDEGDVVQGDVNSGQIVRRFSFGAQVWRAIFSADGRQFLACLAAETSSIVLVDYATGETLLTLMGQTPCLSLAFSPDGASAVSGHIDGSIYHWDMTDGRLIRQFSGEQGRINDLMFTPDGRTVISGSHPRTSALTFWDVATGEPYQRYSEHQRLVYGLDLTQDGRRLLSVSSGATALLSRIDTNEELIEWVHNNRYVPELTCEERELYQIEPLCAANTSLEE